MTKMPDSHHNFRYTVNKTEGFHMIMTCTYAEKIPLPLPWHFV